MAWLGRAQFVSCEKSQIGVGGYGRCVRTQDSAVDTGQLKGSRSPERDIFRANNDRVEWVGGQRHMPRGMVYGIPKSHAVSRKTATKAWC